MPAGAPFAFTEEDIRSWCDGVTFARADVLQKAGNVAAPESTGARVTAEVQGIWSRVDRPTVEQEGQRLHFSCTCASPTLCRHCVALLLHWVRQPDTFRNPLRERYVTPMVAPPQPVLSPQEHMEELLHRRTLADLRALAKRRGLVVKGQLKEEYVARLAALLIQPQNIDLALEGMGDDELLLLTLIDVLRQSPNSGAARVHKAFAVLQMRSRSGRNDREITVPREAVNRLESMGLLIRPTYEGGAYDVPRAVAARTPLPRALLAVLPDHSTRVEAAEPATSPPVNLIDLIQIVAQEVRRAEVRVKLPPHRNAQQGGPPEGWTAGQRDSGRDARGKEEHVPASVELVPHGPIVPDRDRSRLAGQTGASAAQIEFIAELMVELGILPARPGNQTATVDRQPLDRLLTLDGPARWRTLLSAWLALPEVSDLRLLHDVLELRMNALRIQWYGAELPAEKSFRAMVARLIGHLATAPPRWYSRCDLAELCEAIAPDGLTRMQDSLAIWWFTPRGRPHEPLRLNVPEARRQVYRAILGAMLRGPLRWLGMIDVIAGETDVYFRPRPRAVILADRETTMDGEDAARVSLTVDAEEDGTPIVTASFSGEDEMALYLSAIAEPLEPSPRGMRYRVSGLSLQSMFTIGVQGPSLIDWLERHSQNGVPESVRRRIERAWESFGSVRLYDDLTLVELGDDFLHRELDRLTDLRDATIHVFSPRLLAIDPVRVPDLIAALTKAGYRPRVLESL